MKHFIAIIIAIIAFVYSSANASAADLVMTKSYFQQEMGGGGQVPIVSNNIAEVVYFYDNNTVKLRTGTVWQLQSTDAYGNRYYRFIRNEGMSLPGYSYQALVISADYTRMQMNYLFGFMGRMCQMYSAYQLLADGESGANDWMNNKY